MEDKKIFLSSNLKYLRNIKKKTQTDVAKYCNKKNTAISNWELGLREPDAVDLIKLAMYYDVSVDDLMLNDMSKEKYKCSSELYNFIKDNKDILTNDDAEYIKFIIEKRKKEIDKKNR